MDETYSSPQLSELGPVTFDTVREIAAAFPGIEEGVSYGTPAFRVRGRFLARLHQDGVSLVIRVDEMEQDFLINLEPDVYYITDHYRGSPYVLVRLAQVHPDDMRRLFEQAWRRVASKHLIAEYEHSLSGDSTT